MGTDRGHGHGWLGRRSAMILLVLLLGTAGCGGFGAAVAEVSLEELATAEDRWDGRTVRTTGLVRTWDDPRHYWIEDDFPHRVELTPDDAVNGLVGQLVQVEGRFTSSDEEGRRLTVDHLDVIDPSG